MAPDTVFIALGALPIVAGAVYGFFHLRPLRDPVPVRKAAEEKELVNV